MDEPLEIERKYLIRYPDVSLLERLCESRTEIEQVYGRENGLRARKSVTKDETVYTRTQKRRVSPMTSVELESPMTEEEYRAFCEDADPQRRPVVKTRYRVPYLGQMLEIDLFPFWSDRAYCEVELERETQEVRLPGWLTVIRELTGDERYTNRALAKDIPEEEI